MRSSVEKRIFRDVPTLGQMILGAAVALLTIGFVADAANAVPRKVKRACKGDYKSLCPHYKIGTSRMRACMRSKGRQLSWSCYQSLKDAGYVRIRKRGRSRSSRRRRR